MMTRHLVITTSVILLLLSGGLRPVHPEPAGSPTVHPEPVEGTNGTKSETIYTCPMHPQIRQDHPGSCPICGMTLVPVSAQETSLPQSKVPGFATIQVNPTQQWLIGVQTSPVVRQPLVRRLRTVGTVAYDPGLYVAQKEYLEARRTGAVSLIQAVRRRLQLLGMTPAQIQKLEKRDAVDESLFLTEGTGRAWIYSTIYESERPLIHEGFKVEAQTVGHPQKIYEGTVDAILPVVNPMNRTITVRSAVDDPINLLKPDMFVDVYIEIPLGEALTVPKSAVLKTGKRNIVMVDLGNGIFEPREVLLGNASDDSYQIVSGLNDGEKVVTSANFLIDSESQLRGAFSTPGSDNEGSGGHQHGQ